MRWIYALQLTSSSCFFDCPCPLLRLRIHSALAGKLIRMWNHRGIAFCTLWLLVGSDRDGTKPLRQPRTSPGGPPCFQAVS